MRFGNPYSTRKSPLVSVVVSVFNGDAALSETIDSILSQQSVDLELIIVNDGSTDGTLELLRRYSRKHCRINVLHQNNRGLSNSLIRGCAQARGEFIARQDVGDVSRPYRFIRQVDALRSDKELAYVSCWTEFVGPNNEPLYTGRGEGKASKPTWILSEKEEKGVIDGPTSHGSVMFRRDSYNNVGGYRKQFVYGQDWDLWYRLSEVGKFQMIDEILYQVRITPGSISARHRTNQNRIGRLSREALSLRLSGLDERTCLEEVSKICNERVRASAKRSNAWQLYFVGECLRRNKDSRCREYFKSAIKDHPMLWRAWVRLIQARIAGQTNADFPTPGNT